MGRGRAVSHFRVDYQFSPPGAAQPTSGTDWVSGACFNQLVEGGVLNVIYDAADPSTSAISYPGRAEFHASDTPLAQGARRRGARRLPSPDIADRLVRFLSPPVASDEIRRCRARPHSIGEPTQRGKTTSGALLIYRFADAAGGEVEGSALLSAKYLEGPESPDPHVAAIWRNPLILYDPGDSGFNELYRRFDMFAIRG